MLSGLFSKVSSRIKRQIFSPKSLVKRYLRSTRYPLRTLGTSYGGWTFLDMPDLRNSTIISCGAGEDISFDVEMMRHYGATVIIVDPTPRAIQHFRDIRDSFARGQRQSINRSTTEFYDLGGVRLDAIIWIDKAVWTEPTRLKFYEPRSKEHVSHSIANLQETEDFIEVDTVTMPEIVKTAGVENLSMVKMDIEGAECEVLRSMVRDRFLPKQILVELEDLNFTKRDSRRKISSLLKEMENAGYALAYFDGKSNCTFVREGN